MSYKLEIFSSVNCMASISSLNFVIFNVLFNWDDGQRFCFVCFKWRRNQQIVFVEMLMLC